jgi:hydrogenase maturation factor
MMKPGKLTHDLLAEMLDRLPALDQRVIVGPGVGEDAAVLDLSDRLLICAMDPITFATDLIGWYAVHVNANDIAVMGGTPRWFLGTLLLPPEAEVTEVAPVFDQIADSCREIGVSPIGGHTEVTIGIDRPILVGCMLGEAPPGAPLTSGGAQPGDAIVLCGGIAVEGTAILAREAPDALQARGLDRDAIAEARNLLFDPGISVVPAARAAASAGGVTAMHDPTEGGLATGLSELALASGVGLEVDAARIAVLPLTERACSALKLDPLGLIASGSLLVTAQPARADGVAVAVRAAAREVSVIGRVLPQGEGQWLISRGERRPLPEFARDELARFFEAKARRAGGQGQKRRAHEG